MEEMVAACPQALTDAATCMLPAAAFYWAHVPIAPADAPAVVPCARAALRSPRVFTCEAAANGPLIVCVRGTRSKSDLHADLQLRFSDVRSRACRQIAKVAMHDDVREAAERIVLPYADGGRVHHGMFVRAAGVLTAVLDSLHTSNRTEVRLYGHSLGAACASMVHAWLRAAGWDSRAAVMSCPNFCDATWRARWLGPHDDDARFRHYYTSGDPVVRALPQTTGLDSQLAAEAYVCPMVAMRGIKAAVRRVMAHVVYQPTRFSKEGALGPPVPSGCPEGLREHHVLVNPRHRWALEFSLFRSSQSTSR
jgi:hypothetical protein